MLRKNALDQWLDFIQVDGRYLELNRNPVTNKMEAVATVYNTDRSAQVRIQSAENTAMIDLYREDYMLYKFNPETSQWELQKEEDGSVTWVRNEDPVSGRHLIEPMVHSLNDGLNYFKIFVKPVNSGLPTREYTLIINYMNVDVYLDDLQIYDWKMMDPGQDGNYPQDTETIRDLTNGVRLPFTDMTGFHSNVYDYEFGYEPYSDLNGNQRGAVRVFAEALKSNAEYRAVMRKYYMEVLYAGQVQAKYYDAISRVLADVFPGLALDENGQETYWLMQQTLNIINGEGIDNGITLPEQQIGNRPEYLNNKTLNPGSDDFYKNLMEDEKLRLTEESMENEYVVVHIGDGDYADYPTADNRYDPNKTAAAERYQDSAKLITVDNAAHLDYLDIPVYVYVPTTGFARTYHVKYHVYSDDDTLKPTEPIPDGAEGWDVLMGVKGYEPNHSFQPEE